MKTYLAALALSVFISPALAEVPRVVTDIPAVHSLVAEVMGDLGDPVLLLEPGADEHHYQMRPSQARALQEADLLIWIGPELTPWLERALDGVPELRLLDAPQTALRDFVGVADVAAEAIEHDEHDHDGHDPHAWLSPLNARAWLDLIAARLAELDPENAGRYFDRAAAAETRITELDARLAGELAAVADLPFLVHHDAYGYFADHYGLSIAGALAEGDAAPPGAARISELRALAQSDAAICVFPDAAQPNDLVRVVSEGTGLRQGAALDATGSMAEPGAGLYEAILTGLADAIADCLAAN